MSNVHPQSPSMPKGRNSRVGRQILESWPLLVWLGVLVLAVWAYTRGVAFKRMNGTVSVYQESVAPLETGRLIEVLARPGDPVSKGDVIARMDTSLIDKRIEELKRELRSDREDRIRRYQSVVDDLESELRELKLDQAGDSAELAAVKVFLGELEELLQKNLVLPEAVQAQRTAAAELEGRVQLYPEILGEVETRLRSSREKLEMVREAPDSQNAAENLSELDILVERKKNMDLRAVHDGNIYRVYKEPGEIVNAGEAVVKVVAEPTEILGLLPQERLGLLKIGDDVWVSSTSDRHTAFATRVTAISPRVSNTPDRSSPLPNKMIYGREVILDIPPDGAFLPGQTVIIHLEEPGGLPFLGSLMNSER